jgi:cell division protein FtsL
MFKSKKIGLALMATLIGAMSMAQQAASTDAKDKAGFMRSEGKIYVVVAVALTILAGLILYVARLDRKITKLEKRDNN